MQETIVFVCPHNAAKSVIAAAYFQQRADQLGLALHAVSAGTEPSPTVSAAVVEVLRKDGLDVAGYQPRLVTPEELTAAARIVSLGSDLQAFVPATVAVDDWDDVPPPSQDLGAACQAIRARVEQLITELQVTGTTEEERRVGLWLR